MERNDDSPTTMATTETAEIAENAEITAKYRLVGKVQAVGFRHFLRTEAAALGIAGWARNEPDGGLVVLVRGDGDRLSAFARLLREGPPGADVGAIAELAPEDADPPPAADFAVL